MDRITNESNLWLNAIKMEDEGNYLKAFSFYLEDAGECVRQNSLVRAGLSCSCAADCLAMTGNLAAARQLYAQAASIYENNVHLVIGHSVREALWSYKEAYEYFNLACENDKAEHIYEKYLSLSRKINPFFGEKEAVESMRMRKTTLESSFNVRPTNMQVSADIDNTIKNFLNKIGSVSDKTTLPVFQRIFDKFSTERNNSEKSITN
jgi:tetratricopeptide (TPR) repeat protein